MDNCAPDLCSLFFFLTFTTRILLTNINKQLQQQERKEKKKTKIINITRAKKQNEENYWCVCVFS